MRNKIIMTFVLLLCLSMPVFVFYKYSDIGKKSKGIKTVVNATIVGHSLDDMIIDSEFIIQGKVEKVHSSKWSNPDGAKVNPYDSKMKARNILTTDIDIKIKRIFKGIPYNDKIITVRNDKGNIGNTEMIAKHVPDFVSGEDTILFLRKDDSDIATNENYYKLVGYYQGKFSANGYENGEQIFLGSVGKIKPSQFKDEIDRVLEKEKIHPTKKITPDEIRENNKILFK